MDPSTPTTSLTEGQVKSYWFDFNFWPRKKTENFEWALLLGFCQVPQLSLIPSCNENWKIFPKFQKKPLTEFCLLRREPPINKLQIVFGRGGALILILASRSNYSKNIPFLRELLPAKFIPTSLFIRPSQNKRLEMPNYASNRCFCFHFNFFFS